MVNPKKTGFGITVGKINDSWHITFNGNVDFYHDVINGRPISHALQNEAKTLNEAIKRSYEKSLREIEPCNQELKPYKFNRLTNL